MTRARAFPFALAMVLSTGPALAVGPVENPDNGAASFGRGGAWLAVASDPIAAHYNPAGLATQGSAGSFDLALNFNHVCFDRRNPGNQQTGPNQGTSADTPAVVYRRTCNRKGTFPRAVPSLGLAWRLSDELGIGLAIVPPAAYGTADAEWPLVAPAVNNATGQRTDAPAPHRLLVAAKDNIYLFPTLSAGYEVARGFRLGAGFIAGFAMVNEKRVELDTVSSLDVGDHAADERKTAIRGIDPFVPGFVLSVHWSASKYLDLAAWYRWIDAVDATDTDTDITTPLYDADQSELREVCDSTARTSPDPRITARCGNLAVRNKLRGGSIRTKFPQELRAGVRFHWPRATAPRGWRYHAPEHPTRDPLRDDVFDVEFDVSYTKSSEAGTFVVRPPTRPTGLTPILPGGVVPPNSDRDFVYQDTFGARLGGQYNVIRRKLGLMLGAWIESAASGDEYLHVSPVASLRGGIATGVVVRQDRYDLHVGYQRHLNRGFDNEGDGAVRAGAASRSDGGQFAEGGALGENEFRSFHSVNGGRVTQFADVFVIGALLRF